MKIETTIILAVTFLFSGCRHSEPIDLFSLDSRTHWMSWDVFEENKREEKKAVNSTIQIINDEEEEVFNRRLAVYQLFHAHVRPGWKSKNFREAFFDSSWLDDTSIELVGAVAGYIPVPWYNEEIDLILGFSPFDKIATIPPDTVVYDPGAIYMCLHGIELSDEDAMEKADLFLRGQLDSDEVYIVEFSISYPPPEAFPFPVYWPDERFTRRGHGVIVP